ncbi:hypothetical protein DPMN_093474, partial [Dreissena polymorpha]
MPASESACFQHVFAPCRSSLKEVSSRKRALANSVDPDETPHAASHQGLRYLLKGIS